jgi:hypothetical protein
MKWNLRYKKEAVVEMGASRCKHCGQADDGSHQVVSNGECRDRRECKETQEMLKALRESK